MNKRPFFPVLWLAAVIGAATPGPAAESPTYVIPVRGQIERALLYVVRRGVREAQAGGAGVVVLDMDTPGGRLDVTREIIRLLLSLPDSIETYTYVNSDAISAGAIIAMATRHIYMAPASRIGDTLPVLATPFGTPQELPGELREKALSPTVALIRSVAQQNGYDPELAEAMVRPEASYMIGDDVICATNKLLTLTNTDAERLVGEGNARRPLLSSGTVRDLDALLRLIGRESGPVIRLEVTAAEQIARFIEGFPMSGILLALGLLGIYVEFKTPGFGLPGIAGMVLLAVWFWGHHIAGLAGLGELVLFFLGAALLAVEIFFIPGFGLVGFTGLALIVASLITAMVERVPGSVPAIPLEGVNSVLSAVKTFAAAAAILLGLGLALARFLPETPVFRRIMLSAAASVDQGYRAAADTSGLKGRRGTTTTPLRPSGSARFGPDLLSVVTEGEFVETGRSVAVIETHGNRIVVQPVENGTFPQSGHD